MAELIGPEGQVVIEQEIRERLGVEPGWQALSRCCSGQRLSSRAV